MKENKKKQDIIFLLGGCRSGKSSNAQQIAEATAKTGRLYLATCIPNDNEMHSRVEKHQAVRDESWTTIECPLDISDVIREKSDENNVILVDCITLWINNLLADGKNDEEIISEAEKLAGTLKTALCRVILVSNEVGGGIVPENSLARRFRDLAGEVNQIVAGCAQAVFMTVAGIPVRIKG